ncbi:MAG: DNA-binding protein [Legionellales bacterium]|nr:DNA-binding protein [Legionellales bacterium]
MSKSIIAKQVPSLTDVRIASQSGRELPIYIHKNNPSQQIKIISADGVEHSITVPVQALEFFAKILLEMGKGSIINIIPSHAELTTQEAADLLNVSRPYLVKLLESGEISFHKVGKHRRIRYKDLQHYKNSIDEERGKVLDELTQQAQEDNEGY